MAVSSCPQSGLLGYQGPKEENWYVLVGHINERSEWWRTAVTRPRFAQIPGTESQIVKQNGDMPVIVKWGGLQKKKKEEAALSAFFVCGLFHFLRAVNG